ncbi:MAG: hypothetical protein FRX49_07411 [Trebouxia sp. A1-2]|nr:MAG: hypothetical protein FRX49_07411 [Trebouxia sp. A1-2]
MSHPISGNYVIKFERNSFRVQLSTRGIPTCFASAQPNSAASAWAAALLLFFCFHIMTGTTTAATKTKSTARVIPALPPWEAAPVGLGSGAHSLDKI